MTSSSSTPSEDLSVCFHCGAPAGNSPVLSDGHAFCCHGCKTVFEILSRNQMCDYYSISAAPGRASTLHQTNRFAYLDDPDIHEGFIERYAPTIGVVRLHIPQMHCSSCIWLLENLQRLDPGVQGSRTEFLKKRLTVRFDPEQTTLRRIVEMLASIGYEPELNLGSLDRAGDEKADRSLFIRVGVAAFCFGNIMLLSLPEYLSTGSANTESRVLFFYLNLLLSLPVVFYSAAIYFTSAGRGLARRIVNIDVPIALGIAIVFVRSAVDVLFGFGPGYFDSLTGLVFLLLVGKVFQIKTFDHLRFDRRYESYLPLAITVREKGEERQVPVTTLKPGARVILRNTEVLPADGVLMSARAQIDYSFVTGEARPTDVSIGTVLHAGGRIVGAAAEVELVHEVSQSSLAQIWESWPSSGQSKARLMTLGNTVGKYFTLGILLVSSIVALAWVFLEPAKMLDAVTAVLIIACPCALSLAAPFAFGTAQRLFSRQKLFLKNADVVEALARIDTIVFDKTGTLTSTRIASVRYEGIELSTDDRARIGSIAANSVHPLSRAIAESMKPFVPVPIEQFEEHEGEGVEGIVDKIRVRLGSQTFLGAGEYAEDANDRTRVHVSLDGRMTGLFEFQTAYRPELENTLNDVGIGRQLHVLSGDGDAERERIQRLYPGFAEIRFRQTPADKLEYIRSLQSRGRSVLMIGDGLNDAAALWQSDVGIAVTEDISAFSPACDGIIDAASFGRLPTLLHFPRSTMKVVHICIGISLVYNAVGLWFAAQAALSPLLAAILMPASSITVVALASGLTRIAAKRKGIV